LALIAKSPSVRDGIRLPSARLSWICTGAHGAREGGAARARTHAHAEREWCAGQDGRLSRRLARSLAREARERARGECARRRAARRRRRAGGGARLRTKPPAASMRLRSAGAVARCSTESSSKPTGGATAHAAGEARRGRAEGHPRSREERGEGARAPEATPERQSE
jgi:hypothetical protein